MKTKPRAGMTRTKTRKPNAQDATLRNIRALKRRVSWLETKLKTLEARLPPRTDWPC